MDNLLFSINAIAPIFIMILIGFFLKRKNVINDNFINISTSLVFKIALPSMLFLDIAKTDFHSVFNINLILFSMSVTFIYFIILCIFVPIFIHKSTTSGAFIQGVFRSNYAILGLPIILNLFGESGFAKSALVLSFVMPLYNILATIVLTITAPKNEDSLDMSSFDNLKGVLKNILKNPLILSVLAAIPFSYFKIPLPEFASKSIGFLSNLTTPMALIGMGGTFTFEKARGNLSHSLIATILKIVFSPLFATIAAIWLGFRGDDLGVLFILFASPTAVSSFIMAKAMSSDADLASNIVVMTTLGSVITLFIGIYTLKTIGVI